MDLLKKGSSFIKSQSKKLSRFPIRIILMQILAKFAPFFKLLPGSIVQKICLKSQEEIINYLKINILNEIDINKFKIEENRTIPKVIWVMWLQGFENAPLLIKQCLASMERYAKRNNFRLIKLTADNISDYIEIPDEIETRFINGKLNGANYSDYCRCALLAKYGGFWIDSTVFMNSHTEFNLNNYLNNYFFSVKHEDMSTPITNISRHRWNTYVMGAKEGSMLFSFCKEFLETYHKKIDLSIDYLLIDYSINFAYESFIEVQNEIDFLKPNNKNVLWLDKNANLKYSSNIWNFNSKECLFFKLSRKNKYDLNKNTMLNCTLGEQISIE